MSFQCLRSRANARLCAAGKGEGLRPSCLISLAPFLWFSFSWLLLPHLQIRVFCHSSSTPGPPLARQMQPIGVWPLLLMFSDPVPFCALSSSETSCLGPASWQSRWCPGRHLRKFIDTRSSLSSCCPHGHQRKLLAAFTLSFPVSCAVVGSSLFQE